MWCAPIPTRRHLVLGTATAVAAGLIVAVLSVSPGTGPHTADVRLTGSDSVGSPLGGGTALILGPSGIPTPGQRYANLADELYLQPHGFTGTLQILTTPARLFFDKAGSRIEGAEILTAAIQQHIAGGQATAENPVVVFGYSQSAGFSGMTMDQLQAQGVPSDLVRFVLVGDPVAPNGGIWTAFGVYPATPDNLYPTDIYNFEYDGFADFPRYPLNMVSSLNAFMGIFTQHLAYLSIDADQINDAVLLPGSADLTGEGLTNYYMIPAQTLPLLSPLLLLPVIGEPLYELLEPVTRILVNLGYGNITDGWSPGPANEHAPLGLFPADLDWSAVQQALVDGAQQGFQNAISNLFQPWSALVPLAEATPFDFADVVSAITAVFTDLVI
ncbi:PE-PPE domain-containing protein [Mycobacterium sp. UM_Kg1]|uniref:PE-PPE domain-containing protein n=1 Tax=Mycobacterium sp. UM_Kg1 TaxID=1545691 RepID=UPI000697AB1B|nr:PE-PPE domain-containing protein [Mycobacterium sp. UM_Kg1]